MILVKNEFGILISQSVAFKVEGITNTLLHGSIRDHYFKVGSYIEELKRANPSSVFILAPDPNIPRSIPVFQRFFVYFNALKNGVVNGCRQVLCIDAGFLKTFLGGTLLSAVSVDGNNQMFPVAWGVAEGENNDSWEWFLTHLRTCIGSLDGSGWTIISNQHKAILHSVSTILPSSEHRYCARHIYANWKKVHKGEDFKRLFWTTARTYNKTGYQKALDELKEATVQGANDFVAQKPKSFCRAFVRTEAKCDYVVNNMAETFNAYIVESRSKHLIYMLEDIRLALMQRVYLKREQMTQFDDEILPRIRIKLELEIEESRNCTPYPSSNFVFEIGCGLDQVHVDLNAHTCTCKAPEDYVHPYLKREMYLRAYEGAISQNRGETHWPSKDAPLDPPPIKIGPGRPKRNRRRDPHEDPNRPGKLTRHGREMTCSLCQRIGHNKRKFPDKNNIQVATLAPTGRGRPRGRPQKQPTQSFDKETPSGREIRRSGGNGIEAAHSSNTVRGGRRNTCRGRGGRGLYEWFTAGEGVGDGSTEGSVLSS